MIYVLVGIIGLLVIILVAMGIMIWQDKDYVYTEEDLKIIVSKNLKNAQGAIDYNHRELMTVREIHDELNNMLKNTFKFNSKYNVGDTIVYSVNGNVRFGNVKNIIVEVAKNSEEIYQYELYLYLTQEGDSVYEEQIITKQ